MQDAVGESSQHIRQKLKEMTNAPSGSGGPPKKQWHMFERMLFLKQFMKHRQMQGNYPSATADLEGSEMNDETLETGDSEDESFEAAPRSGKRRHSDRAAQRNLDEVMAQYFKKKASNMTKSSAASTSDDPDPDADMQFLRSLQPEMSRLSRRRKMAFKIKVLGMLGSYAEEQMDEDDGIHKQLQHTSSSTVQQQQQLYQPYHSNSTPQVAQPQYSHAQSRPTASNFGFMLSPTESSTSSYQPENNEIAKNDGYPSHGNVYTPQLPIHNVVPTRTFTDI